MCPKIWPTGIAIQWKNLSALKKKGAQLIHNNEVLATLRATTFFGRFYEGEYAGHSIRLEYDGKESISIYSLDSSEEIGFVSELWDVKSPIIFKNGQKFRILEVKDGYEFSDGRGDALAITEVNNLKWTFRFILLKRPDECGIDPGLIAVLSMHYALIINSGY